MVLCQQLGQGGREPWQTFCVNKGQIYILQSCRSEVFIWAEVSFYVAEKVISLTHFSSSKDIAIFHLFRIKSVYSFLQSS